MISSIIITPGVNQNAINSAYLDLAIWGNLLPGGVLHVGILYLSQTPIHCKVNQLVTNREFSCGFYW